LIERGPALLEVCTWLRSPEVGLVTLTGPAGVGKTRLASEAAHRLAMEGGPFPDGVTFVDLSGLDRPSGILPAIARALLAQAGVKPGSLTLHMIIPTNHGIDATTIAQAIAGQLEDVGIHLVVEPLSFPAYVASIFRPKAESDTELFLSAISPPDLTALPILLGFRCDWLPPHGQNFEFYCNKSFDQALASASTARSRQQQAAGYGRAMKIVWNDAPRIWLFVGTVPVAYASDVTGISVLPNQEFRAEYAHPVR